MHYFLSVTIEFVSKGNSSMRTFPASGLDFALTSRAQQHDELKTRATRLHGPISAQNLSY